MKVLLSTISMAVLAVAAPLSAIAQMNHDHSVMSNQTMSMAATKSAPAVGEVRKVDRTSGTVTLKHGPLIALNMPPMTMTFVAKQPALLANVKEGDRVRFTPEMGKDGALVVSTLEVVKN